MNSSPTPSRPFQPESSQPATPPPSPLRLRVRSEPDRATRLRSQSPCAFPSSSKPHPTLVPRSPSETTERIDPAQRERYSLLALWHLLSLDAPTVAALWTVFIARGSHVQLPWTSPAAMFIAVWIIYVADRLFDARRLDLGLSGNRFNARLLDIQDRHYFHHRHRAHFLLLIVLSAMALTLLLGSIDPRSLHLYAVLAILLAAWMLLIHAQPSLASSSSHQHLRILPKELAVGIFFPAAVFIPTLARTAPTPQATHLLGWAATWLRPSLLPSAILFACACTLNCLYLHAWEHPSPHPRGSAVSGLSAQSAPSLQSHWSTRWGTQHLKPLAWIAITLCALTALACLRFGYPALQTAGLPALACALSIAALQILDRIRRRLSPIHLRSAADLVLLTPLLLLPFTR